MKKFLNFAFLLFALTMISCEEDTLFTNSKSDLNDNISIRGKGGDSGHVKTGRWLILDGIEQYNTIYNELRTNLENSSEKEELVILVDDPKGDYGTTYDPNPTLANWEKSIGHFSLRKKLLLDEDSGLRNGEDPSDLFFNSDNRDITDKINQSLFSHEAVLQIGSSIYFASTSGLIIEVINNNANLMNKILDNGTGVMYQENNLSDIRLNPRETYFGKSKDCTADFGTFKSVVDQKNGEATYSFLWNNGDAAGASDLQLTWNFGDGTVITGANVLTTHTFKNLKPKPTVNTFAVCLTASYSITDEEGNVTQCSQTSCQTITIEYEEEDEDPLFTCQDAQIVGSIINFLGLIDLISVNPTPGNAEQVCVDISNLVLGSGVILNGAVFEWTFQGQGPTEGLNACFIAPCDGTYTITLTIKLADGTTCLAISDNYHHNVEANCEGKKDIQFKESFPYTVGSDPCKVNLRAKHQTKYDNGLFNWGKNQVEAEQTSYIKKCGWLGCYWKKTSRRHFISMDGNVYPSGNACLCEGTPFYLDPTVVFRIKTESNTEFNKQVFPSAPGIFCKVNDPYCVTFDENSGSIVQEYCFPQ